MKKNLLITMFLFVSGFLLIGIVSSFNVFQVKKPWIVPEAAKNKKNPVAAESESISTGKSLWSTHCKSCHGSKGLGDGSKAAQLKTEPGNLASTESQAQTDGELFYKSLEGRDDMPSFKKKISDPDDIWSIVNFIRTFKK